jgi:uncharacterized glyoxalase superfamily protein PhnB
MRILVLLLSVFPVFAAAQETEKADVWEKFRPFIGEWTGTGERKPGKATLDARFEFFFNSKFIRVGGTSAFEPREGNPEGEVHQDIGYISYDKTRDKYVLRQFNVEGFVNQYVLENLPADGKTFVFVSEYIENFIPDWKAKVVYTLAGDDEMEVAFNLAGPTNDYQCYMTNHLQRKKVSAAMNKITANLMVEDVNATVDFYRDVLGFELEASVPEEGELHWAMMVRGGVEIMFQSAADLKKEYVPFADMKVGGSLLLFIEMRGVETFYAEIKDKVRVTVELHDTFYGMREFTIEDADGYTLTFAEQIEQ